MQFRRNLTGQDRLHSRTRSWGARVAAATVLVALATTGCTSATEALTDENFATSPEQYLADLQQEGLQPSEQSQALISELSNGATDQGQVYVLNPDQTGVESTWLVALTGTQNDLNSVQLGVARSLGDGQETGEWEGNEDFAESGWHFQHENEQIAGLRVDQMSMVDGDGQPIETWLIARPRTDLLLGIRTYDSNLSQVKETLTEMIEDGQKDVN